MSNCVKCCDRSKVQLSNLCAKCLKADMYAMKADMYAMKAALKDITVMSIEIGLGKHDRDLPAIGEKIYNRAQAALTEAK